MVGRELEKALKNAARKMPIITLIGPRQSGKTTLAKKAFSKHAYVSLERPNDRNFALEDPEGFLARYPKDVVIDEVQRVPHLLSYLQDEVDQNPKPGKYILTGSQNFILMQNVSQTLAGRTALFTLLPFSLTELNGSKPLNGEHLHLKAANPSPRKSLWQTVWTGCYPRIHDQKLDPQSWLSDYHRTYVERDLRDVLKVMDLDGFERFVRLAAARTGQELNYASLATDAGVSPPTAKQWMTALRISSMVTILPPHYRNYQKRLRKTPKLHFLDTGYVCYLLGIRTPEMLENHPLRGPIFESFIVAEMTKTFVHKGKEAPLFHWRDATGHEMDLLVDLGDKLIPIEIKSGMTVSSNMFEPLRWWQSLTKSSEQSGVLIHGGSECYLRQGVRVRPWWIG